MSDWETVQFPDEKLPRTWTLYQGFQCRCEPADDMGDKFGIVVFGSEGDWQGDDFRLLTLYEYWNDSSFKGFTDLEAAKKACCDIVDRFKAGTLKPSVMERGTAAQSLSGAAGKRRMYPRKARVRK